jgi:hypothetical protein
MMRFSRKALALAFAAVFCISAAGCSSTDKSWSMKDGSETLPVGCYIYNLYYAYSEANSQKTDSTKTVFEQNIDDQDGKTWIRSEAYTLTKEILLIDQKMTSMNLTLSDTDTSDINSLNSSTWSSYSTKMEKYGIAQSSFNKSYGEFLYKKQAVFKATYGKGGTKAVSDSELKDYYLKNYTDFSYIVCALYATDSSGNYSASFTDDQIAAAKAPLDTYAAAISAGSMTMEDAATVYANSLGTTSTVLHTDSINAETNTSYPDAFLTELKAMNAGDVKAFEVSDAKAYVLLYKNDAAANADTKIASETDRESLLYEYKSDTFSDELKSEAAAMSDVTVNDAALNSYDPKMFA